MKIVAGDYFGKNIQFVCRCCNCVYEVESKEDWKFQMVSPYYSYIHKYEVPEYKVICPNCKHEEYLGFDPDDLEDTECENLICQWIPLLNNRKDWNERFRIEAIGKRCVIEG